MLRTRRDTVFIVQILVALDLRQVSEMSEHIVKRCTFQYGRQCDQKESSSKWQAELSDGRYQ